MALKAGAVIDDYPYLWFRQARAGETEGRKPRPVCVAVAVANEEGSTHLALLAISSQPPTAKQVALAIPQAERHRIGLDADRPAWVSVDEYNYDVLEESYYLPRKPRTSKSVSPTFLKLILNAFKETLKKKAGRVVRM